MDEHLLNWLQSNEGETFKSPRNEIFKRKRYDFEITNVEENRVRIYFVGSKYPALPLYFWMFDRTIEYLKKNENNIIRLGAKVQPPYEIDTIEGQIWKIPYPDVSTSYKVAPHVCDILALAKMVDYSLVNTKVRKNLQGVKYVKQ